MALYIKIVYNNKTKNNFLHDRRLEGTYYGHLVKQAPTMHLEAHTSFSSFRSFCFESYETILVKILVRCR